ncbi:MAG: bifunctional sulfate adenylyltransferase subunit 1/adenylylsulfate kinase, partial [Solirubrobacterales bacterium]|nr:bifunctional sulfate adenylyltransferase subunit 1/adenylylsulfate kinase [Solirubrobacterales bacterium]
MTTSGARHGTPATLEQPPATAMLRLVITGSVDDGKSTLIGRLLYDSKQILTDQLEALRAASERRNGEHGLDLSLLTDGLRAEREQGITIDVAYRYFQTPHRKFIIADTPGHERYTRNMVTGASTADLAVILIDARKGVVEQTRRHAFIASLLGIRHLAVCVNKMDLVDYSEARFEQVEQEFREFCARLESTDVTFIPVSAVHGENVVDRSEHMPWYQGPGLLYHLEHVHISSDRNLIDCRFPVQWVIRPGPGAGPDGGAAGPGSGPGGGAGSRAGPSGPDYRGYAGPDYRGYAGQIAAGVFRSGDPVVVLPSGEETRIASVDTSDGGVAEACAPMSVTLRLDDDLDISRGDMICRPHNRPTVDRHLEAIVCWMTDDPIVAGGVYAIKHTTRTARAVIEEVRYRIDVNTLHRDASASQLGLNDIGRIRLRTTVPMIFDEYRRNRTTGSFILIDEATNATAGAGMIIEAHMARPDGEQVTWDARHLERGTRWALLGQRGATVWMTGLPAAGKSTIAAALEERIARDGYRAYRLDGDNLRHGLNSDLGFDPGDRAENIRRVSHVASLFADSGTIAIVSAISPYAVDRQLARSVHALREL